MSFFIFHILPLTISFFFFVNFYIIFSGSIDSKQKSYFVFASDENKSGILKETLFLLFSSILYIAIILLFDYKVFARLYQFGFNQIVGTGVGYKGDFEDPDVGDERDKVDAAKSKNSCNYIFTLGSIKLLKLMFVSFFF